ncbi:MAG TPA: hypothetical protein VGS08_03415, partial [Candidatus Saccharimonadales bacterium]|nr:hypothetical protein [Candidatus Saccharimonadales bacterium]
AQVAVTNTPSVTIAANSSVNLSQVGGSSVALGQTTMAASVPVTIASNNTGPVEITDGTNTANVNAVTGKNGLYVVANSATGSTVPTTAFYVAMNGSSSNLKGLNSATAAGTTSGTASNFLAVGNGILNSGGTMETMVSASNATNTTGTGVVAAGGLSVARTALPTAATATNYMTNYADKFGRQVVIPQTTRDLVAMQSTTITSSIASTTVVTAAGSNVFADISSIVLGNSSASATLVTLSDGTNSYYFYVPPGDTRGASYQVPLAATTANTAWTVTCGTSVASLYVTVQFLKNQ